MNILILGSGGRESTFAWKLSQSKDLNKLYIAPGNAGTSQYGRNVALSPNDFAAVGDFALSHEIGLILVGPEEPLVKGIHDYFLSHPDASHIPVIGPQQQAAQLEGSKDFSKQFMERHGIPTAAYQSFDRDSLEEGLAYLDTKQAPIVLKADGLAAGKGVLICQSIEEAKDELQAMIAEGKFGAASSTVVIEDFLSGIELSVFALTDGKDYKLLPSAKDYKRIGEGDTGLNTGGMGAVSPVPFATEEFLNKIEERIVKPTINGFKKDNLPYVGFVFIGLIKVGNDPKVIEYNVRMGDPETEVVLPRLKNDFVEILQAMANGTLDKIHIEIDERAATTIMLVSGGYPEDYEKGKEISGIEAIEGSLAFHAGAQLNNGKVMTSGGRVMAITSYGSPYQEAIKKSYQSINKLHFDKMYFRKDIGNDL